jgi:hypothetical protein
LLCGLLSRQFAIIKAAWLGAQGKITITSRVLLSFYVDMAGCVTTNTT